MSLPDPSQIVDVPLIWRSWNRYTSATPEEWSKANPARGQCAVTALIVQDVAGGGLLRALVNGESHYWNLLPNGVEIDLTLQQFGPDPEITPPIEERDRIYVLSFPETRRRYRLLLQRLADTNHVEWMVRAQ